MPPCTLCDNAAVVKGMCNPCYSRERVRAINGQTGPFTCPDCGVETGRAFKDWSGVRCSDCRYKVKRQRLKAYFQTPEGKASKAASAKRHGWTEKDAARQRAWRERPEVKERERVRRITRGAQRRALEESQLGTVSPDIRQRLYSAQGGKCAGCSRKLKDGFHLDHVVPLSKGGQHDDFNLQALCPSCNTSKHNRDPVEWAQSKGRLL